MVVAQELAVARGLVALRSTAIVVPSRPQTNTVAAAPRKQLITAPASPAAYPTSIMIVPAAAKLAAPPVTPRYRPTYPRHAVITAVTNANAIKEVATPPQPQSMKMAKKPRP